ncbi:MAG: hypothetical protein NTV00_16475 [Methylococcales bacterium]|nr:hypothetical protein [Methylococcales bacterium]
MNKIMFIPLLLLASLAAEAACYVKPLTTTQLTEEYIEGQIIRGEGCRGVGVNSAYTADHYSFLGKVGDMIDVSIDRPTVGSMGIDGQIDLVDPTGAVIAHTTNTKPGSVTTPLGFTLKLPSSGLYTLVVTGLNAQVSDTSTVETVYYLFVITSSNPLQTSPSSAACPSDKFNNGILTLNSVNVLNASGSIDHYQVTLNVQPASNPAVFTIKNAELIK